MLDYQDSLEQTKLYYHHRGKKATPSDQERISEGVSFARVMIHHQKLLVFLKNVVKHVTISYSGVKAVREFLKSFGNERPTIAQKRMEPDNEIILIRSDVSSLNIRSDIVHPS
ncbi:hypothetical protein QQP08_009238 [Theobroma cacao]|nr:hypothetical protein QQP08_009238 [Theobroma cacao]